MPVTHPTTALKEHALKLTTSALFACAFLPADARARQTGEEDLRRLREGHLREIAEATLQQELDYAARLTTLENSFRERKDYLSAKVVTAEREATKTRIAALERATNRTRSDPGNSMTGNPDSPEPPGLLFGAKAATTGQNTRFDEELDALTGFRDAGDTVHWPLPDDLETGGYEVILNYSCRRRGGGRLRIEGDFFYLPADIQPTGGSRKFTSINVGTLRITAGTRTLKLVAESIRNDSLIHLRSLELKPSAPRP